MTEVVRTPLPDHPASRRRQSRMPILRHAILIGWAVIVMFPIFWMLQTSFKDSGEWVSWPPHWLPHNPTLKNYSQIFTLDVAGAGVARQATEQPFNIWGSLFDSITICTISSLIALFMGTFLAYAISRFNVGGGKFRHMVLLVRMIPPIVIAIPLLMYYAIIIPFATEAVFGTRISLFDTRIGLSLLYMTITLPFVIWMMLSFIDEVPYTLEHAARIMGAGRMYTLWKIVLPLVASGMVVTFLFIFILNWAEFLLALTLTHPNVSTLPVLLNKFQSASEGRLYGPQAAIGTVITIPVVIMGVLIQKHLVKGFSFGMMRR
jgi:multiple sugar transport system permease protein